MMIMYCGYFERDRLFFSLFHI